MTQPRTDVVTGVADTTYPNPSISDDWNDRLPKPVTSFADDVARAGNEPKVVHRTPDELANLVETSAGAAPADSELAKAARDVAMKSPETVGNYALGTADATVTGDGISERERLMTAGTNNDLTVSSEDDEDEDGDEHGDDVFDPWIKTVEVFDPSTKTVEEVNTHLADADEAERERVLAAERAGKNRSTVNGL